MKQQIPPIIATLGLVAVLVTGAGEASGSTSRGAVVLTGDAVGSIHFGEPQDAAATSLVKLIGPSEGGLRPLHEGDCSVSEAIYWSNFTAYFYRGRFDGYQAGSARTGNAATTFKSETPGGLRVGESLARARSLYGSALRVRGDQNGVYALVTASGTIRGYLSSEPNLAPPTKVTILTVSAGTVGCPAMSPG